MMQVTGKKSEFDKAVEEMDRQWNCLKGIPVTFNPERTKKTVKCLEGGGFK